MLLIIKEGERKGVPPFNFYETFIHAHRDVGQEVCIVILRVQNFENLKHYKFLDLNVCLANKSLEVVIM
jgi:hypothetical protein